MNRSGPPRRVAARVVAGIAIGAAAIATQLPSVAQAAPKPFDSANDLVSTSSLDAASSKLFNKTPATAKRSRLAKINDSLLKSKATGQKVRFQLFPGKSFSGVVSGAEQVMDMDSWSGTLTDGGYFLAVRSGDAVLMHVASKKGVYEVSKAGTGAYRVIELDQSKNTEDAPMKGGMAIGKAPKKGDVPAGVADGTADSGAFIDIMVAYTKQALAGEGSLTALKARIGLGVVEMNQGYANSGVNPRVRLVHVESAGYDEVGDFDTDLARIVDTDDGYMDNIHNVRNTYGADMVGLVLESPVYCGLASAILANQANAFMTVARGCVTGYYSFAHEFGHLQGARHDTYVDPSTSPFPYGHGMTYPAAGWRTIMAYNNACAAVGVDCTRINYWTNPAKTYGGVAMGSASVNNNSRVLNETAVTVANWRTGKIGSNFSNTFNGAAGATGWSNTRGSWTSDANYYSSTGVNGNSASAKRAGNYGDVTYTVRARRVGSVTTNANRLIVRGRPNPTAGDGLWQPSYSFQWTNSGQYSVYETSPTGATAAIVPWTVAPAGTISATGFNVVKVTAVGPILRLFINGTQLAVVSDSTIRAGQVGVGFYRATGSTNNRLYVDSASLQTTATAADQPMGGVGLRVGTPVGGGTIDQAPQR